MASEGRDMWKWPCVETADVWKRPQRAEMCGNGHMWDQPMCTNGQRGRGFVEMAIAGKDAWKMPLGARMCGNGHRGLRCVETAIGGRYVWKRP